MTLPQKSYVAGAAMLVLTGLANAQSPATRPEFEVASIKLNTSGTRMVRTMGFGTPRFVATNVSLRMLIPVAYNVRNVQVSGGTGAIDSDRYDIEAKSAEAKPTLEQTRLMLQALLADRFKLKVHRETREVPMYALFAGKGGIKLAEPKAGGCTDIAPGSPPPPPAPGQAPPLYCGTFMMGPDRLRGSRMSTKQLIEGLSNILGRPVIDQTGYTGTFDANLEFSTEGVDIVGMFGGMAVPPGAFANDDSRPSVFTALQDQLGLKLEAQKGQAEILVIDHAEKASEN